MYIKNVYNNPKVMILGNGCGTAESTLENLECVSYFKVFYYILIMDIEIL